MARAGAFHHLVRRNAALIDTGLSEFTEYAHAIMSLPLTADGFWELNLIRSLRRKVSLTNS